ncbi:MAG TPA: HIT domain-containing protein [Pseudomonas xinjiangensis]|uniref:HIT domain-containing protein n=2 Tax=root TaxID=1 RepID=A0A7V1BNW9_9GAMM|nr:HIT domain-containing protein [Halopseudomonas xinjiangensis]HEC47987.1 HIT domain-containing protein [Halopseudomonas xinjiangensis]
MFELHPQLAKDGILVGDFRLSRLLLINDKQYPWFVLVPRRPGMTEIFQLDEVDRVQLLKESCLLAQVMTTVFATQKLNIAALGNMVSQLHVHHIARYPSDPAWPAPVWGKAPAVPYSENDRVERIAVMREALTAHLVDGKFSNG